MWKEIRDWLRQSTLKYRLPQVAIAGTPFLAERFGQTPFIWPPLGSLETYAASIACVLISVVSLLPQTLENQTQVKLWISRSIALALVAFVIYAILVGGYVISVETPSNGVQTRSVGFRVEPRIRAQFREENDAELLKIGGLEESQILRVWTPGSVHALRFSLLISVSSALGLVNVALGAGARLKRKG